MKPRKLHLFRAGWSLALATFAAALPLWSAESSEKESTTDSTEESEVVTLSPFEVTTDEDEGYGATNSISGSRINTAIKDIPIAIQIFTSEFIQDTGATDLRESLSYAANITINSQNDLENSGGVGGIQNSPYGPGGVNNPSGITSNISGTQMKIRGFLTNNVLRNGFLRGSPSDAVNIDRVEVVQGPNALLYGTGNFGGVVDYLTRRPSDVQQGQASVSFGTDNFIRTTLDVTGPISVDHHLNYRLAGSWESAETNIDHQDSSHVFIAPSVSWRPTKTTNILVNAEFATSEQNGVGFRALRAAQGTGATPINNDQLEATGFYWPPGANKRTFNLGGPDTYNDQDLSNVEVGITQQILEETETIPALDFFAGYNYSRWSTKTQDANGGIQQVSEGNPGFDLSQTITLTSIDNGLDGRTPSNGNLQYGTFDNEVVRYSWNQNDATTERNQLRLEFVARKSLFDGTFFELEDQLLVGYSDLYNVNRSANWETLPGEYSFKGPLDLEPIRFGRQGDGSAAPALYQNNRDNINKGWDDAYYVNNFLKMFSFGEVDDRLTLMTGIRWDTADNWSTNTTITAPTATPPSVVTTTTSEAETSKVTSKQFGLMLRLTKELSLFALKADGFQPNFGGLHNALTGAPVGADTAESEEIGLKFDLFDGKISGSFSRYKITKNAWLGTGFSTPAPFLSLDGHPRFNPDLPIIYNLGDANGTGFYNPFPGEFVPNGQTYTPNEAQQAAWIAAANAGAITLTSPINGQSATPQSIYLNASMPEGAAWMDAFFAAAAPGWAGWPYYGNDINDPGINNATLDDGAFQNGSLQNAIPSISEAQGWDGMILFTPTDQMQFVFSFAIDTSVELVNKGQWIRYPYPEDRWATWYFPNGGFGLKGQTLAEAYTDPADTSTRTNTGTFPGDDTPENRFTLFGNYRFEGALKGWTVGGGLDWSSKRAYFSGVTHGSGQVQTDTDGEVIVLYMPDQLITNAFVRKEWNSERLRHSLQLNIYNLLNDQDLYGLIYSPPISARATYTLGF